MPPTHQDFKRCVQAPLAMLLVYSCLGPMSVLNKITDKDYVSDCAAEGAEDGSIATTRALYVFAGIHGLAFVSGLLTVSAGQPLFSMVKKAD